MLTNLNYENLTTNGITLSNQTLQIKLSYFTWSCVENTMRNFNNSNNHSKKTKL